LAAPAVDGGNGASASACDARKPEDHKCHERQCEHPEAAIALVAPAAAAVGMCIGDSATASAARKQGEQKGDERKAENSDASVAFTTTAADGVSALAETPRKNLRGPKTRAVASCAQQGSAKSAVGALHGAAGTGVAGAATRTSETARAVTSSIKEETARAACAIAARTGHLVHVEDAATADAAAAAVASVEAPVEVAMLVQGALAVDSTFDELPVPWSLVEEIRARRAEVTRSKETLEALIAENIRLQAGARVHMAGVV